MNDAQKLLISLEARTKQFTTELAKANRVAQKNLRDIERKFAETNKKAVLAGPRMAGGGGGVFAGGRFTGAVAGAATAGIAARAVQRYADAWTEAGNKIAAAEQVAGRQARTLGEVNDIAEKTRSGIGETVDLYAKLLRSTKDVAKSEMEVAEATEIVNKAFKAGGAAASEQSAGILQLAQALGSGVLQGDELRSLRENAPLVAQAIADEFNTSVAGLKKLGEEGKLTTDRVFKAILNGRAKIERAFAATTPTIADSLTLLQNSTTEAIGRIGSVTGVSAEVQESIQNIASLVNGLADAFEYIAGSPGGKFLGFLKDVVKELDPIQRALRALANEDLQKAIGEAFTNPQGSNAQQLKRAQSRLEKQMAAAQRGVGKEGGLSQAQFVALDGLRQRFMEGKVNAEEFRKELEAIEAMPGGWVGQLTGHFNELADTLEKLRDAADKAKKAIDPLSGAGPGRGNGQMQVDAYREQQFLADRTADAKRSEIEREIDTRAKAIIDAAEKVGVAIGEAAAKVQAKTELGLERQAKNAGSAMDLIKEFEGFRTKPYWDVNAYRVGYGSDTVTLADGSVQKVVQGISVTMEDATRDLARRIGEFQDGIRKSIGGSTFDSMNADQQAALTSIAYNYGSLPGRIVDAIRSGNQETVYNAIRGLGSDNSGINRDRRNAEAALYISDAPRAMRKGIEGRENFSQDIEAEKQRIALLREQTGLLAQLNPLVNDYGRAATAAEQAEQLLTLARQEGTAAGRELSGIQQLLYGNLSSLTPEAQRQAMAMRELALGAGEAEAASARLAESQEKLRDRLQQSSDFGKNVLGGFIRDLREGKSATEALAGALDKVIDRLLDVALTALFDGPTGSGGMGPLGGLFKLLFPFAEGGIARNGKPVALKKFARGGVSKTAAIFGETGRAEAAVPLPDGRRIPVDLRMPAPPQGARGGSNDVVRVVLRDDSGRMAQIADQQIRTSSGTIIKIAVDRAGEQVLPRVASHQANRRGGEYRL
jgi:tape measure domain-containing protein